MNRMWSLAVIALGLPLSAQVRAIMKPISLAATTPIFGKGRDIGFWQLEACNDTTAPVIVPRARFMMEFPAVHDIPAAQIADQLTRKAAADPRSLIGNNGDAALSWVSSGLSVIGLTTRAKAAGKVGIGISLLQLVLAAVKRSEPNPAPYLTALLPDTVSLAPGACGSYYVAASLTKAAATQGPITIETTK